jgi:hypothetical protein
MVPSSLPSPTYKRHREHHNPLALPFPTFLWVSLAQQLALVRAQVNTTTIPPRPTAFVASPPRATTDEILGEPLPPPLPSINGEIPCITATARSHSSKLLPSQVYCESNTSHSLQSLCPDHAIPNMEINTNSRKNLELYTNTPAF